MLAFSALTLCAAVAAAEAPVAVVVLPLQPNGDVSFKQADGVTAQIRSAMTKDFAKLLAAANSADEKKQAQCGALIPCLADVAEVRGADFVLSGTVAPASDGFLVKAVVAAPKSRDAVRRVEVALKGDADDAKRIDRFARLAVAPSSLRGAIALTGTEGASVELDGQPRGTLPLDAPLVDIPEGEHELVVRLAGYEDLKRKVVVTHGESVEVKAVLLGGASTAPPAAAAAAANEATGVGTGAIVLGSIGATFVVAGVAAGALSFRDGLDVEARAAAQQLAFPRDRELLLRGEVLSWVANGLYVAGAAAIGSAALLALTGDEGGAQ